MIPSIKNILYATDLSKNSAYAFRYAVNSAQKHNASIHILHVMETMPAATQGCCPIALPCSGMIGRYQLSVMMLSLISPIA